MKEPITVETDKLGDWMITSPEAPDEASKLGWQPQVTVPMPLAAINDIMLKYVRNEQSVLLPKIRRLKITAVTKDFFQSKPFNMDGSAVSQDVMGFLSLVLSYAKNARLMDEDTSIKDLTSVMPRTDFTTIYGLIKSELPTHAEGWSLYTLVNILSCYENTGNDVR